MTATVTRPIATLGELKVAIRKARVVYAWVQWEPDDGDYVVVSKAAFLRGIRADIPADEFGHGGRPDCTPVKARIDATNLGDEVFVN